MLNKYFKTLLMAVMMCLSCSYLSANESQNGFDSARAGDYSEAMKYWQQKAELGDAQAQFNLALMYHGGLGVAINETAALQWYEKSAQNGYPWAQEYLAVAYQEGWFGLERDTGKAEVWLKKLEENSYF